MINPINSFTPELNPNLSKGERILNAAAGKLSFDNQLDTALGRFNSRGGQGTVDERLMKASVEMESIFVAKMLNEMRKTVHKTGWINGGHAEKIFEDMLYDEYALSISKNSKLGLANQIYREMSHYK